MGLDNIVRNDFQFDSNKNEFNKRIREHISALSKNNEAKVSSYDNDEIIKRVAKIMNYYALLDEMDAMKDLEMTEDLGERLREIVLEGGFMELRTGVSQDDLNETKKIFIEFANDPEKREQPITEDIIKEAYGRYYKKFQNEPEKINPANDADNNIINEEPKNMPLEELNPLEEQVNADAGDTQAEINEWYERFIQVLRNKGIETDNPLALGVVRVIPKEDRLDANQYFQSNDPEDVENDMKKVIDLMSPAFLEYNADEEVKKPFTGNRDYSEYLTKNTKTNPSDAHKRFLWQMSKEGRLILQNESPALSIGAENVIYTKPDGSMVVLDPDSFLTPYDKFRTDISMAPPEKKEEIQKRKAELLNEFGITDEMANAISSKLLSVIGIQLKANETYLSVRADRVQEISDLQEDSANNPGNTAHNNREIERIKQNQRNLINNAHYWLTATYFITSMVRANPEMFRSADDRKLLSKFFLRQRNNIGDELFLNKATDELEVELGQGFPRMDLDGVYEKLKKMTGCRNYQEMMEQGAVRDANGNPLPKGNLYKYYLKLGNSIQNGKDILIKEQVNGETKLVPYQWDGIMISFYKSMNTGAYADQLSDIERQIRKAKLPGSQINLEVGVKDTAKVIRELGEKKGIADREILENRLSHLVDSMRKMRVDIANKIQAGQITDKDLQQLKLMNRVANLLCASRLGELNPAENYRMKLAEKICAARAIELSKSKNPLTKNMGLKLLLVPAEHYGFLKRVMDSPEMTTLIGNKSAAELDKLLKSDNKDALKAFTTLNGGPLKPLNNESFRTLPKELKEQPKTIGDARMQAGQLLNEISVARKHGEVYKKLLSSAKELYSQTLEWSKESPNKELKAEEYRLFSDKLHLVCQALTDYAASEDTSDLSILREGTIILNDKMKSSLKDMGVSSEQLDHSLVEDLLKGKNGKGAGAILDKFSNNPYEMKVEHAPESPEVTEARKKLTDFIVKEIVTPQIKEPVSEQLTKQLTEQLQKTVAFKGVFAYMNKRTDLNIAFEQADANDYKKLAQITRAQDTLKNTFRGLWSKEIKPVREKEAKAAAPNEDAKENVAQNEAKKNSQASAEFEKKLVDDGWVIQ